jgi:hypothetical protein
LPADTFAAGPTSGQFIAPANGRTPPFFDRQPAQGVSSVLRAPNGAFLVMSDNGFGAKNNGPLQNQPFRCSGIHRRTRSAADRRVG